MEDRERQRPASTFDRAADLYQKARPEYPTGLHDDLLEVTGLAPPAELLDLPVARRYPLRVAGTTMAS
jgi:hypothetical protein